MNFATIGSFSASNTAASSNTGVSASQSSPVASPASGGAAGIKIATDTFTPSAGIHLHAETVIDPRKHITPTATYNARRHITPTARYEARQVIHVQPRTVVDDAPETAPAKPATAPIKLSFKADATTARQAAKQVKDHSAKGSLIDLFL